MGPITKAEIVKELNRELKYREWVYANQISAGKLKPEIAERRKAIIRRVIEIVEQTPDVKQEGQTLDLFNNQ